MRLRLRDLSLPAAAIGLLLLDAPRLTAGACTAQQCLTNDATIQRILPDTPVTDGKGDANFFSSNNTAMPNVVVVLDTSTSMYELPYDVNSYPNSSWISKGTTPNMGTGAGAGKALNDPTNLATCHANTFFEGNPSATPPVLRFCTDPTGASCDTSRGAYNNNRAAPYPTVDPNFPLYFDPTKNYKFFEWAQSTTSPGGSANGTSPVAPTTGTSPRAATGAAGSACSALSNTAGSGGSTTVSGVTYTMTQQQRCQQCVDEAGYYIASNATATDNNSGKIVFSGNWLNYYPPKFLIARKTVTDFIAKQPTLDKSQQVRIGFVTYDPLNANSLGISGNPGGLNSNDGGHMVSSGMTPPCGNTSWDPVVAGSPPTGNVPSNTSSQVGILTQKVNAINWGTTTSTVGTPLAETIFNVGQFYGGDNTYYTNTFGSSWVKAEFTAPTDSSKPLCAACQVNAIVLITDGMPDGDNNLPVSFRSDAIECNPGGNAAAPVGCGTDPAHNTNNLLDDVTNYLATHDIAPNVPGNQNVLTYIIGLGLKVPLLDNAAKYGKTNGAVRADTAAQILAALQISVASVISRATAFSSTAIQTLEVGTGSTALVPRFMPGSATDATWEGHLFRFDLFNEFVANQDKNGDGNLNGVFLTDADGDIVTEDDQGAFHKETCSGGTCTVQGPANPWWDAGGCPLPPAACNTLAFPSLASTSLADAGNFLKARNIWTALSDGSGGWTMKAWPTQIDTSSGSDFQLIKATLNIGGNNACAAIKAKIGTYVSGSKYLASDGSMSSDQCALAIMDYVRGFNVLNEVIPLSLSDGGVTVADATQLARAHVLGDIFHSSPVVIEPPVDEFLCSLGLDAQCVSTLYQDSLPPNGSTNPTPSERPTGLRFSSEPQDAYEKYWEDHMTRPRVVMVGANDGMLHAFDAGSSTTSSGVITSPLQGLRQVAYTRGDGHEVWGFIPPDQLPRLWLAMRDGHQTYMDGDIMVRDVWVDGKANDKGPYTNTPGQKESQEFHTIAIASERQGGTHYIALDVTDPPNPKMLWMYPPPCDPEEQLWGETWGQFSPRPPPIGPVLLQSTVGPTNYSYAHTEERWVAFLNGGHDPYNTRGRAAAIVDVYTGRPLFVANFNASASDPSNAMRFAFPATASMADWGRGNSFAQDGFFDTAVLGDEGGQIWTFRFGEPGHINTTTNLVDNWTFGRAYEPNTTAPNNANVHNPIYTSAAITVDNNNWLRAYVGTGDRAHVRSLNGGDCRPDDPMTCIQSGCTVSSTLTADNGTNHMTSAFSGSGNAVGTPSQATSTTSNDCNLGSVAYQFDAGSCSNSMSAQSERLVFASDAGPGAAGIALGADGGALETALGAQSDQPRDAGVPTPLSSWTQANDFVSVVVEGDAVYSASSLGSSPVTRLMSLPADSANYDSGRFDFFGSRPDLVEVTNTTATTTTASLPDGGAGTAPVNSAGWIIRYVINNTVPVVNPDGTTTNVIASIDEKTVTSASIQGGCVLWSTLIPYATGGGTLGCASAGSSVAPFYQADAFTGAPNCAASFLGYNGGGNTYVRFIPRNVISPPPEPSPSVAVGTGVRYSTLEIQPGASEVTQMTVGTSSDILQMVYSLPLTADQHTCRHVDATKCK
jgi:type IV pilus assembly protein PilY1